MPFHDLTTAEQIRNVLTVTKSELTDAQIEGYGLDDDLGVMLDKHVPTWESITDVKQVRLLRMVAKYFCAGTLAGTAQLFVLKKETDGSNEGQKSDKDGFSWLAGHLLGKCQAALQELIEELGEVVPPTIFLVASRVVPTRDPITEPRETGES